MSIFEDVDPQPRQKQTPKPKPPPKEKKKQERKPVGTGLQQVTKNPDGTKTVKPVVLLNEYAIVGQDEETGKPIRSWVTRERQTIAREILDTLKLIDVELFNTNGYISCYDRSTDGWYLFDDASKIQVLADTYIRCARGSHRKGNRVHEPVDTPKNIGEYLVHAKGEIERLGQVLNVMRHPYFDNDYKIINTAGYNKDTQYYLPHSALIEPDAWKMTLSEAYQVFDEAFGSMNYAEDIDKQADFSAFLTPPWRCVVGNTPIVSVTSNQAGSGKGLRQRVFNSIWTQSLSAVISKPANEDELRKQLFAALRSGVGFISIDNISSKLLSDVLATYATEPHVSDRPIYGRALETYPNNLIISVNGNNLRLSEDISTRILPVKLAINESSLVKDYAAEGRKTAHEIIKYAHDNRDKIIGASLRISKEFINDMTPNHPTGPSRFDTWRKYVLGSVYHTCNILEIPYLMDKATILAKIDADPESQNRATLWKAILDIIGLDDDDANKSKPFITGADDRCGIFDLASHFDRIGRNPGIGHDLLGEHVQGHTERGRMTQLGIYFRDIAMGKIHYGWKLVKSQPIRVKRANKAAYRLVLVNTKDFYVPGTEQWKRPDDDSPLVDDPYEGIDL